MISEFRWVRIKRKSGSILLDNQQDSETDIIQVNQTGTMDDESIRQEICDVMEGTKDAFEMRAKKYHFNIKE